MKISRIAVLIVSLAAATPSFGQKVVKAAGQAGVAWKGANSTGWQGLAPEGTWWRNRNYIAQLSLTAEQQKKMDDVFQQARIKLIDLTANLDREEAILEPLIKADQLDESRVTGQIDKVANARAELEKANARMLLGIRQVLTPEQWTRLSSLKVTAGAYKNSLKVKPQ